MTLTAVKRQGEQSGIHRFATTVRNEVDYDVDVDNYAVRKESDCSILNSINPAEITALFTELVVPKTALCSLLPCSRCFEPQQRHAERGWL